jgi:glycosyltransferase involved in cell wall biosynthesis
MHILDVSPRTVFPPRDGAMFRIYHLLRYLSQDHAVRQFSQASLGQFRHRPFDREVQINSSYYEFRYTHPVPAAAVEFFGRVHASGVGLRFARPALLQRWFDWADVTLVEQPWQFRYCRLRNPNGLLVLAAHNFEALTSASNAQAAGTSPVFSFWYRYSLASEMRATKDADLILAVSPEDRQNFVDRYGVNPGRVVVIPNGADTEHFVPVEPEQKRHLKLALRLPDRPTIVFMASKPSPPHAAAFDWIRRISAIMREYTFVVVGGVVPNAEIRGNLVTTGVVEDPCPYLQAADIALCPIQYGGGTKIKVLECLAVGLPMVAFSEAIHGTALRAEEHVLVSVESETEILAALRRLVKDPMYARRLGVAGRALVVERYDWRISGQKLECALLELVENRRRAGVTLSPDSSRLARWH